jgi:hypothetical protein
MRPDRRRHQAAVFTPGEKSVAGSGVSTAGIWVANVGGEEFDIAPGGFVTEIGDQCRDDVQRPRVGTDLLRSGSVRGGLPASISCVQARSSNAASAKYYGPPRATSFESINGESHRPPVVAIRGYNSHTKSLGEGEGAFGTGRRKQGPVREDVRAAGCCRKHGRESAGRRA